MWHERTGMFIMDQMSNHQEVGALADIMALRSQAEHFLGTESPAKEATTYREEVRRLSSAVVKLAYERNHLGHDKEQALEDTQQTVNTKEREMQDIKQKMITLQLKVD